MPLYPTEWFFVTITYVLGALAHLARALRWQRRGERFESAMLHQSKNSIFGSGFYFGKYLQLGEVVDL